MRLSDDETSLSFERTCADDHRDTLHDPKNVRFCGQTDRDRSRRWSSDEIFEVEPRRTRVHVEAGLRPWRALDDTNCAPRVFAGLRRALEPLFSGCLFCASASATTTDRVSAIVLPNADHELVLFAGFTSTTCANGGTPRSVRREGAAGARPSQEHRRDVLDLPSGDRKRRGSADCTSRFARLVGKCLSPQAFVKPLAIEPRGLVLGRCFIAGHALWRRDDEGATGANRHRPPDMRPAKCSSSTDLAALSAKLVHEGSERHLPTSRAICFVQFGAPRALRHPDGRSNGRRAGAPEEGRRGKHLLGARIRGACRPFRTGSSR